MIRCSGHIGPEQANHSRHPMESDLVIVSFNDKGVALPQELLRHRPPVFGVVETIEKWPIKGKNSAADSGTQCCLKMLSQY